MRVNQDAKRPNVAWISALGEYVFGEAHFKRIPSSIRSAVLLQIIWNTPIRALEANSSIQQLRFDGVNPKEVRSVGTVHRLERFDIVNLSMGVNKADSLRQGMWTCLQEKRVFCRLSENP